MLLEIAKDVVKKNMLCKRNLCMYRWSMSGRKEPKANKAKLLCENFSLNRKQIIRAVKTWVVVYNAINNANSNYH